MDAALVTQLPENRFARNFEDRFLQAAQLRWTRFEILDLQAGRFGVAMYTSGKDRPRKSRLRCRRCRREFRRWRRGFRFRPAAGARSGSRELQIGDAFLERGNFILRHLRQISASSEAASSRLSSELLARGLEFVPLARAAALIAECSRMISLARLRLSKRRGSAISRSSCWKRSRLRSMRDCESP